MASPFTTLLARAWIEDGTADEMLAVLRRERRAPAIAARVLGAHPYEADGEGFHLWLPLDGSARRPSELALHLRSRGIGAVSGSASPPTVIRLMPFDCARAARSERDEIEESLQIVAETLEDPHHLHSAML